MRNRALLYLVVVLAWMVKARTAILEALRRGLEPGSGRKLVLSLRSHLSKRGPISLSAPLRNLRAVKPPGQVRELNKLLARVRVPWFNLSLPRPAVPEGEAPPQHGVLAVARGYLQRLRGAWLTHSPRLLDSLGRFASVSAAVWWSLAPPFVRVAWRHLSARAGPARRADVHRIATWSESLVLRLQAWWKKAAPVLWGIWTNLVPPVLWTLWRNLSPRVATKWRAWTLRLKGKREAFAAGLKERRLALAPRLKRRGEVFASGLKEQPLALGRRVSRVPRDLVSYQWSSVPSRAARGAKQRAVLWRTRLGSVRWSQVPRHLRSSPARLLVWWRSLSRIRRAVTLAGTAVFTLVVVLGVFTWSGVSAALNARDTYRELQAELSNLTPVDLVQVNVFQSMEGKFKDAQEDADLARGRLRFLKAFTWVPGLGGKIKEAHLLLDMAFYQGRAGHGLAGAYGLALSESLDQLPPDEAADQVARVLRESGPILAQVQRDLRRVRELREELGATGGAEGYGVLVDRYLPAVQTVAYLSLTSPGVIGHTYVLSRELATLRDLANDPLDVIANPGEVGKVLGNVSEQAAALELDFEVVRRATEAAESEEATELADVREVLDTLGPGITLLRHATAGTRSLVTMAEAIETEGFLSAEFGLLAGEALERSQQELTLAKAEVDSLQDLLSLQGIDAESFLPAVFGGDLDVTTSSQERVEVLLDEALSATRFLVSFLGFDGPKTYLMLGQNEKEIRATGGFIGIAVRAKVERGELLELVFHDSTTVDREPLTANPDPPEGLFWYLWMGRLLFRDANWNPHYPASAAKVREIYRLGQGEQVDGTITGSKGLMLDMVGTFGDISVPGAEGVLTRDSAEAYTDGHIFYPCLPGRVSERGKRCFDEDVFFGLKDRLTNEGVSPTVRRGLVEVVKKHIDRKNIMIHLFQPTDDSFLWEHGWNGAVSQVDHDYLMVVDSSLPGHSTEGVERSWEYRVSLSPGSPVQPQLRLRYDNNDEPQDEICRQYAWEIYHCYWNYFRVYVSPQANEIKMPSVPLHEGALKLVWGWPDADSRSLIQNADTGPSRLTELGGYVAVEPGSVTTIPIRYRLPDEFIRSTAPGVYEYRLLIQKQPGMDSDKVSLAVELPPGSELLATSPNVNSIQGKWLLFDFTLEADTTVVVSFGMQEQA